MRKIAVHVIFSIGLVVVTAACRPTTPTIPASLAPTFTPVWSPTPNPCSTENLPATVKPITALMRRFDDDAALASNVVQAQVVQLLPEMQAVRRSAQDLAVPACLADLKRIQLAYMDATLQTLLAFQKPSPSAPGLATGIVQARQYHDQYQRELAHLFGITLATGTAVTAATSITQTARPLTTPPP